MNIAIRLLLILTALLGIIYPLLITGIAQLFFSEKANGSFVEIKGNRVGSLLIAQNFSQEKYFWPRPSLIDYDPLKTETGRRGTDLASQVATRQAFWTRTHRLFVDASIPPSLLYASRSGLDPNISKTAALFQLPRVAIARGWNDKQMHQVRSLIDSLVEHDPRVFPGESGINVLNLNVAIDRDFP